MNTKEKLMQLLELCIEKNLNFDYSHTGVVTVSALNKEKEIFAVYYRKSIYSEDILELIELIEIVKNHQP